VTTAAITVWPTMYEAAMKSDRDIGQEKQPKADDRSTLTSYERRRSRSKRKFGRFAYRQPMGRRHDSQLPGQLATTIDHQCIHRVRPNFLQSSRES
jgi:hypothetical protein